MKTPTPRPCRFYGIVSAGHIHPDGSWIEDEAFAYPNDTLARRAYVRCPDGKLRLTKAKCADTFFSIPCAPININGVRVRGYISGTEQGLEFRPFTQQSGDMS